MNSDGMGEAAVTLTATGENCAIENVTFKIVATDKNRFWITSIKPTVAGNTAMKSVRRSREDVTPRLLSVAVGTIFY